MKHAIMPRTSDNGIQTEGDFIVNDENQNGIFNANTLERPWLNNNPDISCIPPSEPGKPYVCKWGHMNHLNEDHYEITGVPGRTKVFIHEMNFVRQVEGCVGMGKAGGDIDGDGSKDLVLSRKTLAAFEKLMNKEDFTLEIIAPPKQIVPMN